jgi:chemosensory pili system protein ChpA (sensor histidine kinase/response regulator)
LQLVEFHGAALLAEEMEGLCRAIMDGKVTDQRLALEKLMQGILQLPGYLEHVQHGRRDLPLILLPLLNDIRTICGAKLLSEISLFNPALSKKNPALSAETIGKLNSDKMMGAIRKMRQMYQKALIGIVRNQDVPASLTLLTKILTKLDQISGKSPKGKAWLIGLGLIEGITNKGIELSSDVKPLISQIDKELKAVIDSGAKAFNKPADAVLLKKCLYFIAKCDLETPTITQLKTLYNLDSALPDAKELTAERERLAGPDNATVSTVIGVLIEDIGEIKDQLDLLVRGEQSDMAGLDDLYARLKQVTDTMGVLDLGATRQVIEDQLNELAQVIKNDSANDTFLMDIAGALLYVEATLSGIVEDGRMSLGDNEDVRFSGPQAAVIREARNVLEQAKDCIIEFIAGQWTRDHIDDLPGLLKGLPASLGMIGINRVADVLEQAGIFVTEKLLINDDKPEWSTLDTLADAITGIEYYLERVSEDGKGTNDGILDVAEESVAKLGYPVAQPEEEIIEEEVVVETIVEIAEEPVAEIVEEEQLETVEALVEIEAETVAETIVLEEPTVELEIEEPAVEELHVEETVIETVVEEVIEEAEEEDDLIDDEIIEIFLEEVEEVLEELASCWPAYKANNNDADALASTRRAFHTLKGSGRMVKAMVVGELSWSIESLFNRLLERSIEMTPGLIDIVDQVLVVLPELVSDFENRRKSTIDVDTLAGYADNVAEGQSVLPLTEVYGAQADCEESAEIETVSEIEETTDEPEDDNSEEIDSVLIEIFTSEAESHLAEITDFIELSKEEEFATALTDTVQRALHTLKGSANMAGVLSIGSISAPLEHMVKEFRSYRIPNSESIVSVLERGVVLTQVGIDQLETSPFADIEGSEDLISDTTALVEKSLALVVENAEENSDSSIDPQVLSMFLAEGMDILFDAESILYDWANQAEPEVALSRLISELDSLIKGAELAELPEVIDLSTSIRDFYQSVADGKSEITNDRMTLIHQAHEELLSMMDFIAAGQSLLPAEQTIEELNALVSSANIAVEEEVAEIEEIEFDAAETPADDISPSDELSFEGLNDELVSPEVVELDASDIDAALFDSADSSTMTLDSELLSDLESLSNASEFVEDEAEIILEAIDTDLESNEIVSLDDSEAEQSERALSIDEEEMMLLDSFNESDELESLDVDEINFTGLEPDGIK